MKNQPTYATRQCTSFMTFRTIAGRAALYLGLIAFGICTYVGLYHIGSWLLGELPAFSYGTGICVLCVFMAAISGLLTWRSFRNWSSCRVWAFATVFFVGFAVQAFLTRGGSA